MNDDGSPLATNTTPSICCLCCRDLPIGLAVVLRDCQHAFCFSCLKTSFFDGQKHEIECPYPFQQFECKTALREEEVAFILEYDEDQWQSRYDQLGFGLDSTLGLEAINLQDSTTDIDEVNSSEQTQNCDELSKNRDESSSLEVAVNDRNTLEDMDFLLALTDTNLKPNLQSFECPICSETFEPYKEMMLSHCFHEFCKECLGEVVKHADDVEVQCPALIDDTLKCNSILLDCEIRALLSREDYARYQDKCVQKAEAVIPNTIHCLQPNCPGWIESEGYVELFSCPVCSARNCTSCKAIHTGKTCKEHQDTLERKDEDLRSEEALKQMEENREGMRCPTCGIMITKIAGCDFMTCTQCRTDICWPTRGPRWGPRGRGDRSGGCGCRPTRRCHPQCRGCH